MRLQLAKPCKNCPFSVAETRIRFSCRERAEEIEEHAYRQGFPCHLSAELNEDDEEGGYEFGANTQHCAGAALMFLNAGYDTWPGIDDRDLPERWLRKLEPNLHLAFGDEEEFFAANDASVDTHPKGGDAVAAPSPMGSAVASAQADDRRPTTKAIAQAGQGVNQ